MTTEQAKGDVLPLDRALVTLLLIEVFLFLSDHFDWFSFNQKKGWTVLIMVAVVASGLAMIALWLALNWIVSRWTGRGSTQFGLRSILLLVPVIAIGCGWFVSAWNDAERQRGAAASLTGNRNYVGYLGIDAQRPYAPPIASLDFFGQDFFHDVEFATAKDDAEAEQIAKFSNASSVNYEGTWGFPSEECTVSDRGLAHLRGITNLQAFLIDSPNATSGGLAFLRNNKKLETLLFDRTQIDDGGLEILESLPKLGFLRIGDSNRQNGRFWEQERPVRFENADLERLKLQSRLSRRAIAITHSQLLGLENPNVREWGLKNVPQAITDAGLVHLEGLTALHTVDLHGLRIDGSGLRHLAGANRLQYLSLNRCQITDEGLATVKDFPILIRLELRDTLITDAGLENLKSLPRLQVLWLDGTRVDGSFCQHLVQPSPLDGLSLGSTSVNDDSLANVCKAESLAFLFLRNTSVTDAGLIHLQGLQKLGHLDLSATQVRGAGLKHLKSCKRLQVLDLRELPLDEEAYMHLERMDQITRLYLDFTPTKDAHLELLAKLSRLRELRLDGTQVTDAGLAHLKHLGMLQMISLKGTKATKGGEAMLIKALPRCRIER